MKDRWNNTRNEIHMHTLHMDNIPRVHIFLMITTKKKEKDVI